MVSSASSNHSKVGAGSSQPLRSRLHRYGGRCSGAGEKPVRARVETKRSGREVWRGINEYEPRDATRLRGRKDVLRNARRAGGLIMGMMKARAGGLDMRPLISVETHLAKRHRGKKKLCRSGKSRGENL